MSIELSLGCQEKCQVDKNFEGHPAHLFYFKGLAKLGASWIATLYPTSSKEILLIKIIGAQLC